MRFAAGTTWRARRQVEPVNVKYAADNRYLSMQSFVRTGNAYGREFAFHEIPDVLDPFDYEAFRRSAYSIRSRINQP